MKAKMNPIRHALFTSALCLFLAPAAEATSILFKVDFDILNIGGTVLNESNATTYSGLEALGFFVDGATYNSFLNEPAFTGTESWMTETDYASLLPLLNAGASSDYPSDLASAEALQMPPSFVQSSVGVFNKNVDSFAEGMHAVLVVHDGGAGNVQNLTVGNYLGVVTTSFMTLALGSTEMSFAGLGERWTDFLIGAGSTDPGLEAFILAEIVVPEPSAAATLAGLSALGLMALRRRPRRSGRCNSWLIKTDHAPDLRLPVSLFFVGGYVDTFYADP